MVADPAYDALSIRPWHPGDERLLREATPFVSIDTIASRFFMGAHAVPEAYLRYVSTAWPAKWNAVVAVASGRLVGWAEFGRYDDNLYAADLGVLVVDAWQHRGIGPALVEKLLPLCHAAGIVVLRAEVLESNHSAQRALARISGGRLRPRLDDGVLHYTLPTRLEWLRPREPRHLAAVT
jgi:RimJ/RimL family protein N-acetyltransferase